MSTLRDTLRGGAGAHLDLREGGEMRRSGDHSATSRLTTTGRRWKMSGKEDGGMKKTMVYAAAFAAGCLLALAPAPALPAAEPLDHTIRSGDNLHLIAGYYFGDPRQWKRVWKVNRKALGGPDLLVPGKTLRIVGSPDDNPLGTYEDYCSRVRGN